MEITTIKVRFIKQYNTVHRNHILLAPSTECKVGCYVKEQDWGDVPRFETFPPAQIETIDCDVRYSLNDRVEYRFTPDNWRIGRIEQINMETHPASVYIKADIKQEKTPVDDSIFARSGDARAEACLLYTSPSPRD